MSESTEANNDPIRHVVVLILENHSFDQMLGCFRELYPELDGVDPSAPQSNTDDKGHVLYQTPTKERQMLLDPHHELEHVEKQMAGSNGGFVRDFAESFPDSPPAARQFIMGYYPLGFLPALHALARDFTICDRWHASLPGPTWPNRFFALSGTSMGRVSIPDDGTHKADLPGYFQQTQKTIFDRLNERCIHWKVYFHDIPQTAAFARQREPHNVARYFYIDEFFDDARGSEVDFPQFSLIEPSYMGWGENDDHPPHDIMRAEKLIADVFNSLRANSALWLSTLLVVFYDEHGGFYDHVEPPKAPPPDAEKAEYTFDRLGLRVPAVLVSPWVGRRVEHTLFDHTSLLNYLIDKWGLGPLGARTATANNIRVALTERKPRDDPFPPIVLTQDELTPPDPVREEKSFDLPSTHHMALQMLSGFLEKEAVTLLPRFAAWTARYFECLKSLCARAIGREPLRPMRVTIAEPDRLAHRQDARPRDSIARFLMHRKLQAVDQLAVQIRDEALTSEQRDHALRTLGLILRRDYHKEDDGLDHAKHWLNQHLRQGPRRRPWLSPLASRDR